MLPGSYLVVESLDRLTREEIQPALLLILSLLQKGIRVVQLKPVEMTYDAKSDTTPIILMLVELSRGHSESKVKSDRVSEAWSERRKDARAGKGVLTRQLPLWVEERDGKLVAISERAQVVRRIFELSASGLGLFAIMARLKKDEVPAFGKSGRWSISYLDLILKDRRAIGEFQPKLRGGKPDGEPIANYFPRVVTEEQWERGRMGARLRFSKPGRIGGRVNVFQGLLKSARDGFSYTVGGVSKKNPHPTIRSAGYRLSGGPAESFPLDTFEAAVLSCLKEIDPHQILESETRDESLGLAGELANVEADIVRLEAELDRGGDKIPSVVRALGKKEGRRKELAAKLAEVRQRSAHPLSESWGEAQSLLRVLAAAPDQREARLRLREALRRIVSEIRILVVPHGRDRFAAVQVWFATGEGSRHRDYLVQHRAALVAGNRGVVRRGSGWSVRSFADGGIGGELDLRVKAQASRFEKDLLRLLDKVKG